MKASVRQLYRQTADLTGQTLTIQGWVRTIRDQKQFGFISLNDGTFFLPLQVVFSRETLDNYDQIAHTGNGAALIVTGQLKMTPGAKQPFELLADKIEVEGDCPPDYPLQPKRHSPEFLRTIAHLRARTNLLSAAFRVRSVAAYAIHRFFNERDFVYVHTPIITGSDAEGAGQMFAVTTLDLGQPTRLESGEIDFGADFFGR